MKPTLILGLGNPLMGDDSIGYRVAELLAMDPRLPANAEAIGGGTDLLRWMDHMEGRSRVILIDAILGGVPGSVEAYENDFGELESRQWNVHHLSAPQAVRLLQRAVPAMRNVRFTLLAVRIGPVEARMGLSPALNARLPAVLDTVLDAAAEARLAG